MAVHRRAYLYELCCQWSGLQRIMQSVAEEAMNDTQRSYTAFPASAQGWETRFCAHVSEIDQSEFGCIRSSRDDGDSNPVWPRLYWR